MASSSVLQAPVAVNISQPHTAPIIEFRCLFTPDLRKKQKKWQDGKLKFHTHNRRVMVYDERGNYVGDSHWQEGYLLAEGEELQLERGGVLVEVQECVGQTNQDLTELVDKRIKEREQRAAVKAAQATPVRARTSTYGGDGGAVLYPPSRPLNELLTPSGHYGRALLPITSPFEDRQESVARGSNDRESGRPTKRQKMNENVNSKSGYAQNLMGATLNLSSSRPPSTAPIRYERLKSTLHPKPPPVDLTLSDDENQRGTLHASRPQERKIDQRVTAKKISRRSPPAKSGYASNLTGAQLILSAHDARPSAATTNRRPGSVNQPVDLGSSSSEEEEPCQIVQRTRKVDIASREPRSSHGPLDMEGDPISRSSQQVRCDSSVPEALHKSRARLDSRASNSKPRKERSRRSTSSERPGSDEGIQSAFSKPAVSKKSTPRTRVPSRSCSPLLETQCSSNVQPTTSLVADPAPERSMSSLRIKSRPRGKMMMLMSRQTQRSVSDLSNLTSTTKEQSARKTKAKETEYRKEKASTRPKHRKDDVVMSQATARLHEFVAKQDARLQSRLHKRRILSAGARLTDSDEEVDTGFENENDDSIDKEQRQPRQERREIGSNIIDDVQVVSSPITDKGIDHHKIDAILTHKMSLSSESEHNAPSIISSHSQVIEADTPPLSPLQDFNERPSCYNNHSQSALPYQQQTMTEVINPSVLPSAAPSNVQRSDNVNDNDNEDEQRRGISPDIISATQPEILEPPIRSQRSPKPSRGEEAHISPTETTPTNSEPHALGTSTRSTSASVSRDQSNNVSPPPRPAHNPEPSPRLVTTHTHTSSPPSQSARQATPTSPPRNASSSPSFPDAATSMPPHFRIVSPGVPQAMAAGNLEAEEMPGVQFASTHFRAFMSGVDDVQRRDVDGRVENVRGDVNVHAKSEQQWEGEGGADSVITGNDFVRRMTMKISPAPSPLILGVVAEVRDENVAWVSEEGERVAGERQDQQVPAPGPSTLEAAEEVTSTIDMADIPLIDSTCTANTMTMMTTMQQGGPLRPRRANPATTRGLSLSALAASTVNAPPIDSSLPFTASGNVTNVPPSGGPLLSTNANANAGSSSSLLQNVQQPLHVKLQRVGSSSGPQRLAGPGLDLSSNMQSSTRAVLAKRIYPPPPIRVEKVLHDRQAADRHEQGRGLGPDGTGVLWLGGYPAGAVQQNVEAGRDGRQDGMARKESGLGVATGAWSREAFDLFGEWVRPVV